MSRVLVENGQAFAEIVVDAAANNGVKLAAEDLRDHLDLISGVRLEIVDHPGDDGKYPLFVGESCYTEKLGYKLPEFNNSGYDIFISEKFAVLTGPSMFFPEEKNWTEEEFHKFMGEKLIPVISPQATPTDTTRFWIFRSAMMSVPCTQ